MKVIRRDGTHEIEIQRSRFLCHVARVASEQEAAEFFARIRKEHWQATHNCTAFRTRDTQRSSDDGEPAGTAGVPMLEVLTRRDLVDTAVVVTRYYGGIKLGAGGLVRAYGRAVSEAIDELGTLTRERHETVLLAADHDQAGKLENALRAAGYRVADTEYGHDVTFTVHTTDPDGFGVWLAAQTGGAVTAIRGEPVDLDVSD
ncbi:YigZ family protein [Lentzea nigeriaca]|uniref:YigZ family protein n=1 Tax=Lentzea nigeriaca TaxID=1128665 RepID=UPI001959305D|nr:YigZ family protein [Lentzea nigeriaca]MBM7856675.1 putative YigZ family protein [Lentzea nigeriaca]